MRRHVKVLITAMALLALFGAPSAWGATATFHPFLSSFDGSTTPAGGMTPQAIALDQGNGDLYVIDASNQVVDRFDSSGAYLGQIDGAATPPGAFAFSDGSAVANALAIDESGTATDGNLYVADPGHGTVNVFDDSGAYLGRLTGSQVPTGPFGKPDGLAVDAAGSLYVADAAKNLIYRFAPAGNPPLDADYETTIADPILSSPAGMAFDRSGGPNDGDLYVVNYRNGGSPSLNRFDPSGSFEAGIDFSGSNTAVAVNQANGDVYSANGSSAAHYSEDGVQLDTFGTSNLADALGIVIDGAGKVQVADQGLGSVIAFSPEVAVETPTVTIEPATGVTTESAHISGTVNPGGGSSLSDTSWQFQYSTDGTNWQDLSGSYTPAGTSDVPVEADVQGLSPATQYFARLLASNSASEPTGGPTVSDEVQFTTESAAPSIENVFAADVRPEAAELRARINPNGEATSYRFEYGLTDAYGSVIPVPDASVGAGNQPVQVSQGIDGLEPGTTYHFRVVTSNLSGQIESADRTFGTPSAPDAPCPNDEFRVGPSANLPDCRAYERVSPAEKNHLDIDFNKSHQVSIDGNAIVYAAFGAFAGSPIKSIMTHYLARRGSDGWSNKGITPPTVPTLLPNSSRVLKMSRDFSHLVARTPAQLVPGAWSPGLQAEEALLYRQTPSSGLFDLLTPEPIGPPPPYRSRFVDGDDDFSHILIETTAELTSDAVPLEDSDTKLYLWAEGSVELISKLPGGVAAPVSPSKGFNQISSDGSRVFFTAKDALGENALYVREAGVTTELAPSSSAPVFMGATNDGRYVFWPDGANSGHLVRQDVNTGDATTISTAQDPTSGPSPGIESVVDVSDDGSRVYFIASEGLVDGAVGNGYLNLYLWDQGVVKFVYGFNIAQGEITNGEMRYGVDMSASGNELVIASIQQLTGIENSGGCTQITLTETSFGPLCQQVFIYDAGKSTPAAPQFECVSCPPGGGPAHQQAGLRLVDNATLLESPRYISVDGHRVLFYTEDALVPRDTNGKADVYLWDDGAVHLISTGRDGDHSLPHGMGASGGDVFFITRERLVGWDTDKSSDVYDARVGGGFPEPPPPPQGCEGDSCLPPPIVPNDATPASASFSGSGSVRQASRARCRQGFRRRNARCVKKRSATKRTHRAKADGRAK